MNRKLNELIKQSMFFVTIFAYLIFRLVGKVLAEILSLNDISGWKMQIRGSGIEGIFEISMIAFLVVYLLLDIKKKYRNNLISKLHLITISIGAILKSFGNIEIKIYLSIVVFAIILFLININFSINNVKKRKT